MKKSLPKRANKEALFEELALEFLSKKYSIPKDRILELAKEVVSKKEESFPIKILTFELSSLEAIVKYLKENKKLSYQDIGKLLLRNPRTLAVTYSVARKKHPAVFDSSIEDSEKIPFKIFSNKTRTLSVLECISTYLHDSNHNYSEIARMLNKDPRTIWTVCKRAEKKLRESRRVDE